MLNLDNSILASSAPLPLEPNFLSASVFGVSYTLWWEVGDGMWDQFEEPGGVFS